MSKIGFFIVCCMLGATIILVICDVYREMYKGEKEKREETEREYEKVCKERDELREQLYHANETAKPERPPDLIVIENLFGGKRNE